MNGASFYNFQNALILLLLLLLSLLLLLHCYYPNKKKLYLRVKWYLAKERGRSIEIFKRETRWMLLLQQKKEKERSAHLFHYFVKGWKEIRRKSYNGTVERLLECQVKWSGSFLVAQKMFFYLIQCWILLLGRSSSSVFVVATE